MKRQVLRGISSLLVFTLVMTFFGGYVPIAKAAYPTEPTSDPEFLSSVDPGSIVQFGGYSWIVLDQTPSEVLLLMQDAYGDARPFDTVVSNANEVFDPTLEEYNIGNIGYLLNGAFLGSLTDDISRERIKTTGWNIGHQGANENETRECKVGLLSQNQVYAYAAILNNYPLASENGGTEGWWTSTWYYETDMGTWIDGVSGNYYVNGFEQDQDNNIIADVRLETDYEADHAVRPAIYLDPKTPVRSGEVIEPQNDIIGFSVAGQIGTAIIVNDDNTISITVPSTNTVTAMTPEITLPNGASVRPASGAVQNFTSPVIYTVTSADGLERSWTVTCLVLNASADITGFSGEGITATIDTVNHTVTIVVPDDTDITSLSPIISVSSGAAIGVLSESGLTGLPEIQDFTAPVTYRVTAAAGNTQDWTVTCHRSGDTVPYKEEHYLQNPTGWGYSLYQEQVLSGVINSTVTAPVLTDPGLSENTTHPGLNVSGQVHTDGSLVLRRYYDRTLHSAVFNENGGTPVRDVNNARYGTHIGSPDTSRVGYMFLGWFYGESDEEAEFPLTLISDVTLRAEWQKIDGNIGDITGFWIPGQIGTSQITTNGGGNSISFMMPEDSDLEELAPFITLPDGMPAGISISPGPGEIQSFTDGVPIYYSITDGTESTWIWGVTANLEKPRVRSFTVTGQIGQSIIDNTDHTIRFAMPYGSDLSALETQITTGLYSAAYIGGSWFPDYYEPGVSKTLFLGEGSTTIAVDTSKDGTYYTDQWTISCQFSSITGFSIPGQIGQSEYDALNHIITVHVPYSTDLTDIAANMQLMEGASIFPLPGDVRDYSGDVYFDVTQGSEAPVTWTIRCVEDFNSQNEITELTIPTGPDQIGSPFIDPEHYTVQFTMPFDTDVSALAPVISASPGAVVPASGTAYDFSLNSSREYMVYAEDNSPQI